MLIKLAQPIRLDGYDIGSLMTDAYRGNDTLAVQALTTDGAPACRVSVNIPDQAHMLDDGEFFVKEWSENEVPVAALIAAGAIVIVPDKEGSTGYIGRVRVGRLASA